MHEPYISTIRGVLIRFFYPDPNLSHLIFSICQYRVPIRYLALTNIFLDNTAALRQILPTSKLFLNSCVVVVVETKYTLSYGSFLFCICYSISSTAFFHILTLSRKITWACCLSISHVFSISFVPCFTCFAV